MHAVCRARVRCAFRHVEGASCRPCVCTTGRMKRVVESVSEGRKNKKLAAGTIAWRASGAIYISHLHRSNNILRDAIPDMPLPIGVSRLCVRGPPGGGATRAAARPGRRRGARLEGSIARTARRLTMRSSACGCDTAQRPAETRRRRPSAQSQNAKPLGLHRDGLRACSTSHSSSSAFASRHSLKLSPSTRSRPPHCARRG